jgi:hypothetical protein
MAAAAAPAHAPPGDPPPSAGTSPKIGALPGASSASLTTRIAELEDALRTLREQVDSDRASGNGHEDGRGAE